MFTVPSSKHHSWEARHFFAPPWHGDIDHRNAMRGRGYVESSQSLSTLMSITPSACDEAKPPSTFPPGTPVTPATAANTVTFPTASLVAHLDDDRLISGHVHLRKHGRRQLLLGECRNARDLVPCRESLLWLFSDQVCEPYHPPDGKERCCMSPNQHQDVVKRALCRAVATSAVWAWCESLPQEGASSGASLKARWQCSGEAKVREPVRWCRTPGRRGHPS